MKLFVCGLLLSVFLCFIVTVTSFDTIDDEREFVERNSDSFGDVTSGVSVVRCYDGDTCTVNIRGYPRIIGDTINIRIAGIDAPEIRGKCDRERELAITARDYLLSRINRPGARIELRNLQRDKYFRILCELWVNGYSMANALIANGLAVEYDGGTKANPWCR